MSDSSTYEKSQYWQYSGGNTFSTHGRRNHSTIMSSSQLSNQPSSTFASLDLLNQINKFFAMKESIGNVSKGIEEHKFLDSIQKQLAPGQTVDVIYTDNPSGKYEAMSINSPGGGYLYDPATTRIRELKGPALEICYVPGKEPSERTIFSVRDNMSGEKAVELRRNSSMLNRNIESISKESDESNSHKSTNKEDKLIDLHNSP